MANQVLIDSEMLELSLFKSPGSNGSASRCEGSALTPMLYTNIRYPFSTKVSGYYWKRG